VGGGYVTRVTGNDFLKHLYRLSDGLFRGTMCVLPLHREKASLLWVSKRSSESVTS